MAANDIIIFDRKLKRQQQKRAARLLPGNDFLIKEAAAKLADHLEGISKKFECCLEIGARGSQLENSLVNYHVSGKYIKTTPFFSRNCHLVADEELPPFSENSFDLIVSSVALHWVNDLPGLLVQLKNILRKDGLLLISVFGGQTLTELRQALAKSEIEILRGTSPRISPFIDVKDGANLLQRAGFSMPVSDSEKIIVLYENSFKLMHDLQSMGETNALMKRQKSFTSRNLFATLENNYREMFSHDDLLPATFEIITLSATKN